MPRIDPRPRKNGEMRWRIRIRHYDAPALSLTFEDYDLAQKWLEKHYKKYMKDPKPYIEWIRIRRLWKFKDPIDTLDLNY